MNESNIEFINLVSCSLNLSLPQISSSRGPSSAQKKAPDLCLGAMQKEDLLIAPDVTN